MECYVLLSMNCYTLACLNHKAICFFLTGELVIKKIHCNSLQSFFILLVSISEKKKTKKQRGWVEVFLKIVTAVSSFFFFFFFNCYLAVPRPTLGHFRGDSLPNPMLSLAECLVGFEPGTSDSNFNTLTH